MSKVFRYCSHVSATQHQRAVVQYPYTPPRSSTVRWCRMPTDCQYIRTLIRDNQAPPGSFQARIVAAHLAQCSDCRALLGTSNDDMLQALLTQPDGAHDPLLADLLAQKRRPRRPRPPWTWMQYLIACTIAACIGFFVADLISSLWYAQRIYTNLGLMVVATPTTTPLPATSTPIPATATPIATPSPVVIELPALTVLLLGSDRRPQETSPARTDAIMVLRFDPQQQRIALLSLPRDLMVNIPGYGWSRINAANVYGDIYPSLGGGMALATQTVSQVIGQPIDYVVRVDFAGFIAAIDTLEGVPVQVTNDLYDDRFPTMDYQYTTVSFQVGETVMDGSTALVYSRIRHPDSDFARMARQQQVVTGIATRLQSGGFLETLATTADITDALVGHTQTTMPRDAIISLAWTMRTTPLTNFSYHVLSDISYGSGEDRYAMYANAGAIERIVQQWLGNP